MWKSLLSLRIMGKRKSSQRMDFKAYLEEKRRVVDKALDSFFPGTIEPADDLFKAMRYSLFAGGKRLRPILCIAGAEAVGGSQNDVLPVACALEMIHTYSLIHDDLPSMDNDDLRRGKPTSHKVFGEAVALLAGDGLLTEAFSLMARGSETHGIEPSNLLRVIGIIADAAGCRGMVGGQVVDVQFEGKGGDLSVVQFIHERKTGALIKASVVSGAILGGGTAEEINSLSVYGEKIGLAFQISDDILDIEGDPALMGKGVGGDIERGKLTYPSAVGLEESKQFQMALVEDAIKCIESFGESAEPLRAIARYIIKRKK